MWLACLGADMMSASRVESVRWQDEHSRREFAYKSEASRTSTILPPVTGHVGSESQQRQVDKLPEWSHYSESELNSRLLEDSRGMSLPELSRQTQMMTSRRLQVPAHAAAAATGRSKEEKWMKNWSSELPASHSQRAWRQSTDSISYAQPQVSTLPKDSNHQSKTDHQQPSSGTALRRSSSTRGLFTDTVLKPAIARKPSLSMDSLTDKYSAVIISLLFKSMLNCVHCSELCAKFL